MSMGIHMVARLLKSAAIGAAAAALLLLALSGPLEVAAQAQQTAGQTQQPTPQTQQPVFRSGVDRVRVDVNVVHGGTGDPVVGLGVDDFEVWLDGRPRRVITAELVQFERTPFPELGAPVRTPGRIPDDARVYVVAIDQLGLTAAAMTPMKQTVRQFLQQLRPQDMVALYEFPYRTPKLDISHDHTLVSRGLDRVLGMRPLNAGSFNLSASEIVDISANDGDVLASVIARECGALTGELADIGCPENVRAEARGLAGLLEVEASQRMNELVKLAQSLSYIQGRKTIVLMSGGLTHSTRAGGRPNLGTMLQAVGDDIANAQANLYVIHLDSTMLEAYSAATPGTRINQFGTDRRAVDRFQTLVQDRSTVTMGLEVLAGRAGGAFFSVDAGTPGFVFDRVLRETTAYYVLGVEPADEDRDGKSHFIRVETTAKGAKVRSRTQVAIPKKN